MIEVKDLEKTYPGTGRVLAGVSFTVPDGQIVGILGRNGVGKTTLLKRMAGILRGAGKSVIPMIVMLVCWCLIRVTYISFIVRFIPDIQVIIWAYPMTWALSGVVFLIYFLKSDWIHGLEKME